MGNQQQDAEYDVIIYAAVVAMLMFGVQWVYESNMGFFNGLFMVVNKAFLQPFSMIPGTDARKIMRGFHWDAPESYTFEQMAVLTGYAGNYLRWITGPFLFWLAWQSWRRYGVKEMYARRFSMESLMREHALGDFPCMYPVAFRSRNILDEPWDTGPWRVARTPVQFVAENGLLIGPDNKAIKPGLLVNAATGYANVDSPLLSPGENKRLRLNREKAEGLFREQMGPELIRIATLPDYLKGLIAAFMAFGAGDKESGQKMLDQMSKSFREPDNGEEIQIDVSGYSTLINKYSKNDALVYATRSHNSYVVTWLMALLSFARTKGVLACSQFIWLRPANRTVWYALNALGGRTAWVEAAGPWAHYQLEQIAGMPIMELDMERSVNALEVALQEAGFLPEKQGRLS